MAAIVPSIIGFLLFKAKKIATTWRVLFNDVANFSLDKTNDTLAELTLLNA